MSRCQNCIFFYFCLAMFQILYSDKDYCRCISFMWKWNLWLSFVYVCENLAPLVQRKVFTEEIFLFMSICWASSRTGTPYFGRWGMTIAFLYVMSRFQNAECEHVTITSRYSQRKKSLPWIPYAVVKELNFHTHIYKRQPDILFSHKKHTSTIVLV